jgi:hypothetical protein
MQERGLESAVPTEIIFQITSTVPNHTLSILARVSPVFQAVAESTLYRVICVPLSSSGNIALRTIVQKPKLAQLVKRFSLILDVDIMTSWAHRLLELALKSMTNLVELRFPEEGSNYASGLYSPVASALDQISSKFPVIDLRGFPGCDLCYYFLS